MRLIDVHRRKYLRQHLRTHRHRLLSADIRHSDIDDVLGAGVTECLPGYRLERSATSIWTYCEPPGGRSPRSHGWKLHVSATTHNAVVVLRAVADAISALPAQPPFKFASTLRSLYDLNSARSARESSGKFITIYPVSDDQARLLGERLAETLRGQEGPTVLTDRRLAGDAPVYYRYGVFRGAGTSYRSDGRVYSVMLGPAGEETPDERKVWFSPPAWAVDPFAASVSSMSPAEPVAGQGPPPFVMLNDRYIIDRALRHSNRGGIYLGIDTENGAEVVLKEARHGIEITYGRAGDARTALQRERRFLELFSDLPVPRVTDSFTLGSSTFLALTKVEGRSLLQFQPDLDAAQKRSCAVQLIDLLSAFHQRGHLLVDVSPNNFIVAAGAGPDCDVSLVDLEHVLDGSTETPTTALGTPGYIDEPVANGGRPTFASDWYGLAAVLCFLFTGASIGECRGRNKRDALLELFALTARQGGLDPELAEGLGRLATGEQEAAVLRARLSGVTEAESQFTVDARDDVPLSHPELDRSRVEALAANTLQWLRGAARRRGDPRLQAQSGQSMDPLCLQSGWSSVLYGLALGRRAGLLPEQEEFLDLEPWIAGQLTSTDRPPSLYFGWAGAVVALMEAAHPAERIRDLAWSLPTDLACPDVCHGSAGLALLYLQAAAYCADERFSHRATAIARELVARTDLTSGDLPLWRIPRDLDSDMAGQAYYGFAHGSAGILASILRVGHANGEPGLTEFATRGLGALAEFGTREAADELSWPTSPTAPDRRIFWCNGAVGIGHALLTGYRLSGDDRLLRAATGAARFAWNRRFHLGGGRCHGLPSLIELFVDLGQVEPDRGYVQRAVDLVDLLWARRGSYDGVEIPPDESGQRASVGLGTGATGFLPGLIRILSPDVAADRV
ncbi:lanthionine synthetase LanC family protein [Kribbella sp. NPDC004536]|uniref:class III lanthionine synthetase LanKC N-terminal domain-containing protein n=1 Tax=Kribbella sp. NPDC004536 TaxID=3364106 RepID=UPI0036BB0BD0